MNVFALSCRQMWLLLAVIVGADLVGCGPPPPPKREFAPVTGKVTYQGQPLKLGQIMFQPPSGSVIVGEIKSDGTYSLDGVVGSNSITIISKDPQPEMKADDPKSKKAPKSYIPEIYGTPSSNLRFDVKAGPNKADFDLK